MMACLRLALGDWLPALESVCPGSRGGRACLLVRRAKSGAAGIRARRRRWHLFPLSISAGSAPCLGCFMYLARYLAAGLMIAYVNEMQRRDNRLLTGQSRREADLSCVLPNHRQHAPLIQASHHRKSLDPLQRRDDTAYHEAGHFPGSSDYRANQNTVNYSTCPFT